MLPARAPLRVPSLPKVIPQPPLPKIPSNRTLTNPKNEVINEKPMTFADIVKQPKPIKKEETQQKQEKQEEEWRPTTPPYAPEDFQKKEDDVWHE
jgi:hypothetical protein